MPRCRRRRSTARSEAAAVTGMPWSWAAGTKCVLTRPFVEAPQIAKVPASSQNVPCGRRRAAPAGRAGRRRCTGGGFGVNSVRPVGGRPTSAGWSRSSSQTKGTTARAAQGHGHGGRPPAVVLGDPGQQRQEDQLPGRARRGEDAGDQAAAGGEPAVGDRRGEGERHRTAAEADQHAPAAGAAARLRHPDGQPGAERDHDQRAGHHAPDAEAVHQRGRERRCQSVQREVDRDGGADRAARPAELLCSGSISRPGSEREGRGADDRHEGDGGDQPGAVGRECRAAGRAGRECVAAARGGFGCWVTAIRTPGERTSPNEWPAKDSIR